MLHYSGSMYVGSSINSETRNVTFLRNGVDNRTLPNMQVPSFDVVTSLCGYDSVREL